MIGRVARGDVGETEPTTLLQHVFYAVDSGRYVEVGAFADEPHAIGHVFQRAGWLGGHGSANGAPIATLLARVGQADIHWMKLHSNALAAGMLDDWTDGTARPWVVALAGTRAIPEWDLHLRGHGYYFAAADAADRYFVRGDRPELAAALADAAWQEWDQRLRDTQQAAYGHQRRAGAAEAAQSAALTHAHNAHVAMGMAHQHIAAIFASTSWRVTKPLRWLARLRRTPQAALRQLGSYGAAPALRVARRLGRSPAPDVATHQTSLHVLPDVPVTPPPPPHPLNLVGPSIQHLLLDAIARQRPTQEVS